MKNKPLGKPDKTSRGFGILKFKDLYGCECNIQQSSLATEDAIWLGCGDAQPKIMASQAERFGVKTQETTGWIPYPIPKEVLLSTRMHLNREQVESLIEHLQNWLQTGKFI